jgi:ubiquinone/menaquinone biosynthesis C-methylase UbiE
LTSDAATLRLDFQRRRATELAERLGTLLPDLTGVERALDSGCGTGALAGALASRVGSVVGVDADASYVRKAVESGATNCAFQVGDAAALAFPSGSFDLSGCLRVLHHVSRPELVVSELARVTRSGGTVLVADQLGLDDPAAGEESDAFERARDVSHTRLLPRAEIEELLRASDLLVERVEIVTEERELEEFLDLVGLAGEERSRVRAMAPGAVYDVDIGFFVARLRQ